MEAKFARLSVVLGGLALAASPALAQTFGNPVYFSPKQGVGLTIAGDYGRGLNNASGKTNYFGGRATLGLPSVAITGVVGSAKASGGSAVTSFGGDVAVTVLKGPMVPVSLSLQAGLGYNSTGGVKTMHVPAGAAIAFNPKTPGASVEPWVAARLDYTRVSVAGVSGNTSKLGASGGVNVGLPSGVGFHVAVDYVNKANTIGSPILVGAGVHYTIKIPSLGVPMAP
jgi:hypothetical protein